MSKIKLNDDIKTILFNMSDGNPGALTVLMELLKPQTNEIDPDSLLGGFGSILSLDTIGIYGTDIYVLYNDICDQNLTLFIALLRAHQLGLINDVLLRDVSSRQDRSGKELINTEEIYNQVKKELPNFGDLTI
jgi:hypothetical protein